MHAYARASSLLPRASSRLYALRGPRERQMLVDSTSRIASDRNTVRNRREKKNSFPRTIAVRRARVNLFWFIGACRLSELEITAIYTCVPDYSLHRGYIVCAISLLVCRDDCMTGVTCRWSARRNTYLYTLFRLIKPDVFDVHTIKLNRSRG